MNQESQWLRISDLERRSGVPRRTIHFYLRGGLLHPPMKTGQTMAYYDEAHLRRLEFIRKAREKGEPLIAIRDRVAVLEAGPASGTGRSSPAGSGPAGKRDQHPRLPQRAQGIKTRETILELGCKLFREKGYRHTKVSDITRELNMGKGSFYFCFSDKKELFLECVPRIFESLFSTGWDSIRQVKNPQKRLELRAQAVLPVLKEFCTILQLLREALENPDPRLKRLGEETFLSVRRPVETDIRKGMEEGLFRDLDPVITSTFLIGIMESLYYLQTVDRQPASARTWENFRRLILLGMKRGGSSRTPQTGL
jgi:AcrR family transcriptional regulator